MCCFSFGVDHHHDISCRMTGYGVSRGGSWGQTKRGTLSWRLGTWVGVRCLNEEIWPYQEWLRMSSNLQTNGTSLRERDPLSIPAGQNLCLNESVNFQTWFLSLICTKNSWTIYQKTNSLYLSQVLKSLLTKGCFIGVSFNSGFLVFFFNLVAIGIKIIKLSHQVKKKLKVKFPKKRPRFLIEKIHLIKT